MSQPRLGQRVKKQSILASIRTYLHATGPNGFEGLVASLLARLTGRQFRLARSGTQGGRDLTSDDHATVVAVECKCYADTTPLDIRELVGELSIAAIDRPDLDLWVLVATRDVDAQLHQVLQASANQRDMGAAPFRPRALEGLAVP